MKEIAPRVVIDEKIRFGKPVIKGTRVPVDVIVGEIAAGMTVEEVCEEYDLKRADVFAALQYAAQLLKREQVMYV